MPKAVFRVDASPEIGLGHWYRCVALSEELRARGWKDTFAIDPALHEHVPNPKYFETADPVVDMKETRGDLLIVDHYEWGRKQEAEVRKNFDRIVVFDDLANRRHDCDLLVDARHFEKAYDVLVISPSGTSTPDGSPDTRLLCGPEYALVRKEFRDLRAQAEDRRWVGGPIKKVLVMITDDLRNVAVRQMAENSGFKVRFPGVAPNIARDMLGADLCIGESGYSNWERCCLGLPTILWPNGKHQWEFAEFLRERDIGWPLDIPGQTLYDLLEWATELPRNDLYEQSRKCFELCDGLGVERVANTIEEMFK